MKDGRFQYLNSGAGGVGGFFLHSDHAPDKLPRLTGWWSNKQENRSRSHSFVLPYKIKT